MRTITERVMIAFGILVAGFIGLIVYYLEPALALTTAPTVFAIAATIEGIVAYVSFRRIPVDPPSFAVPTFWNRRQLVIIPERIAFVFKWFPLFEDLIIISSVQRNSDLLLENVLCKAPDEGQTGTSGDMRSGGEVKVKLALTYAPDIKDPRKAHEYINSGQAKGVEEIVEDMLGETVRREALGSTWEQFAFRREDLSVELITMLTGLQPDEIVERDTDGKPVVDLDPDRPKYKVRKRVDNEPLTKEDCDHFLLSILKNGPSDIVGLGIRVRRLNVIDITAEDELKAASAGMAVEEQQRRSENMDFRTELQLAELYLAAAKARNEELTLETALAWVRVNRRRSSEVQVRSGGNPLADAAAMLRSNTDAPSNSTASGTS